ncbi:MAG: hypothetical protein OXG91_06255, partial [bacterium]|nr:hypothetical protein [bacterium]
RGEMHGLQARTSRATLSGDAVYIDLACCEDRLRPPPPTGMLDDYRAHFATHESRPWKSLVELPQEKFTDVAIASHLLGSM